MKMNEVIRKYRKERGLTQEQVAGYLGGIYTGSQQVGERKQLS